MAKVAGSNVLAVRIALATTGPPKAFTRAINFSMKTVGILAGGAFGGTIGFTIGVFSTVPARFSPKLNIFSMLFTEKMGNRTPFKVIFYLSFYNKKILPATEMEADFTSASALSGSNRAETTHRDPAQDPAVLAPDPNASTALDFKRFLEDMPNILH